MRFAVSSVAEIEKPLSNSVVLYQAKLILNPNRKENPDFNLI
jgi:hypothetical protein